MILNNLKPKHTALLTESFIIGTGEEQVIEYGPETLIRGTLIAPSEGTVLIYTAMKLKQFDRIHTIRDSSGTDVMPLPRFYEVFAVRPALDAMGRVYAYSHTLIPFGDVAAP